MAVNIANIEKTDWSISIKEFGEIVTGVEDVRQSIIIIVSTRKGTYPLDLFFGCGLFDHLDRPLREASPMVIRDIKEAIEKFEPRATNVNVTFTEVDNGGRFTIRFSVGQNMSSSIPGFVNLQIDSNGLITNF